MLDLHRLKNLRLYRNPPGQICVAELGLRLDYALPRRTEIELEGIEHLPRDRPVFLAMNHTDRYNYWPLQYIMYRRKLPFTATWVKGKYYENAWMGRFMDATNNIPLPSRGYVLTAWFRGANGRTPTQDEYRFLRDLVDGDTLPVASEVAAQTPAVRKLLSSHGLGTADVFREQFDEHFSQMIDEVVRLNREALVDLRLNVLVFPQGTRSIRLSRGHTGLMQMAQHLGAPIVPIGCNGSDGVYPGNAPFAKGGRIVYRIGRPLELDGPELGPHRVTEPFQPLGRAATARFGARFQAATDVVMHRINDLLDPPYQFAADGASDGVQGIDRFV